MECKFLPLYVVLLYTCAGMQMSSLNNLQLTESGSENVKVSSGFMNEISNRFLKLENKLKSMEDKERNRGKMEKYLHKSIAALKTENKILKEKVQTLTSNGVIEEKSKTTHLEFEIPGKTMLHRDDVARIANRENRNTERGTPPIMNEFDFTTIGGHTRLKAGGIRFDVRPNRTATYNGAKVLQFRTVTANDGKGFNPTSGIFTCPKSGLYIFGLTISASTNLATAYIFQNNKWITRTFVGSNFGTASVMALLQLKRGDNVYVLNADNQNNTYDEFSHFTGAFISS